MEALSEQQRNEEGKLPRDTIIFTPDIVALIALREYIDRIGERDGEE